MKIDYKKEIILNNINDTINFAKNIKKIIKGHMVFALIGDLGSGKTFFTKELIKEFKVNEEVISPTFNILKTYKTNDKFIRNIYHFDVYRIKSEDELNDIGFYEYIYDENSISIIEWADLILNSLPKNTIYIYINKDKNDINKRIVKIVK